MTVPTITIREKARLERFANAYFSKQIVVSVSLAGGSLICVTALSVIFCSGLCLTLPGVNVVSHVVLYGMTPSGVALAVSLGFFGVGFLYRRKMQGIRKKWTGEMERLFTHHKAYNLPKVRGRRKKKNPIGDFVLDNFFPDEKAKGVKRTVKSRLFWNKDLKNSIVNDLKKPYEDDKKNNQLSQKKQKRAKKVCEAFDDLKEAIATNRKR